MKRALALAALALTGCTMKMSFEASTMKQWDRPAESTVIKSEDTSTNVKSAPKSEIITPTPINVMPAPEPKIEPVQPVVPPAPVKPSGSLPLFEDKQLGWLFEHHDHSDPNHVCFRPATVALAKDRLTP